MAEVILIVDDEESVRRTFREWLEGAGLDCTLHVAADAETALLLANQETIDLAILDWNLGSGSDGLKLLEDLCDFNPDIVAIMVTGYAHQATPLDAMRMGVRDYFDKNQDLNRTAFLQAVRKQLDRIRPAKQARRLHQSLIAFRQEVDKVLPLVQSAAALNDPVPLPRAIGSVLHLLKRLTGASDAVLLVRGYDPQRQPAEVLRAYDADGQPLASELAPFARSLAATVVSMQETCLMNDLGARAAALELQPFERGRRALLATALPLAPGLHAVVELFDKDTPFTETDRGLLAAVAELATELLQQALAERQGQRMLLDAIAAARTATDSMTAVLDSKPETPPEPAVLERMQDCLRQAPGSPVAPQETLQLAEAVRVLALRHGAPAVRHCIRLIEDLRKLLDQATGIDTMNDER